MENEEMNRLVTIMVGVSGSGKSTWIENSNWAGGFRCIVSADLFFTDEKTGEYDFEPSLIGEAHQQCMADFLTALEHKTPVIYVDNTNTRLEEISPYLMAAQAKGYKVRIVCTHPEVNKTHWMGPGIVEYARRCTERNTHGVPSKTVEDQAFRITYMIRNWPSHWPELEFVG